MEHDLSRPMVPHLNDRTSLGDRYRRSTCRYTLGWVDSEVHSSCASASSRRLTRTTTETIAMRTHVCSLLSRSRPSCSGPACRRSATQRQDAGPQAPEARPCSSVARSKPGPKEMARPPPIGRWSMGGHRRQGEHPDQEKFGDFQMHLEFNVPTCPTPRGKLEATAASTSRGTMSSRSSTRTASSSRATTAARSTSRSSPASTPASRRSSGRRTTSRFTPPNVRAERSSKARLTVIQNGLRSSTIRKISPTPAVSEDQGRRDGPIMLQDHGNKFNTANIWIKATDILKDRRFNNFRILASRWQGLRYSVTPVLRTRGPADRYGVP